MNKPLILVVEDDPPVRNLITTTLKTNDYRYLVATDGEKAILLASSHNPDIVLLDLGLPDMDGVQVIQNIRSWSNLPIIVLSARSEDSDKIEALDAGADDYLPKPFNMGELLARVRAMLRRRENYTPEILQCGNLYLNMQNYELSANGKAYTLPNLEYKMMEILMLNQGHYISTEDLLIKVWGYETDADIGIVWVYISYLRKRISALGAKAEIRAKRNIGYTLEAIE